MKYYGEEQLLSENLQEVSSDFSGIFRLYDDMILETTPSPNGVYFRLLSGFPCYEDEDPADIKMTRISMISPEYIKDSGDSWNLTAKEKEKLSDALKANNYSIWKQMIESWNREADSINKVFTDVSIPNRIEELVMPDYTRLEEG